MQNELQTQPDSSIRILSFEDKELNSLFLQTINESYVSLKALLKNLPE